MGIVFDYDEKTNIEGVENYLYHINGIEYLIKRGWIDANTEVWMNIQYPWKQPTYNRILLQLSALGVKFIDPIIGNSTKNIHILYPDVSYNKKTRHQRTISIMHGPKQQLSQY